MVKIINWLIPLLIGIHLIWSREKLAAELYERQRRSFLGRSSGGPTRGASFLALVVGLLFVFFAVLRFLETRW